jgi:hypothetical protein
MDVLFSSIVRRPLLKMRSPLNLHFLPVVFVVICRVTIDVRSVGVEGGPCSVGMRAAVKSAGLGLSTHLFPAQSGTCGKRVLTFSDI